MSEKSEATAVPNAKEVLADYLSRCQGAVVRCLKQAEEHDDPEQALTAARLIKTSIDLVNALEGRKLDFTYRFVDERAVPGRPARSSTGGQG